LYSPLVSCDIVSARAHAPVETAYSKPSRALFNPRAQRTSPPKWLKSPLQYAQLGISDEAQLSFFVVTAACRSPFVDHHLYWPAIVFYCASRYGESALAMTSHVVHSPFEFDAAVQSVYNI
jgi:hypothetical protein